MFALGERCPSFSHAGIRNRRTAYAMMSVPYWVRCVRLACCADQLAAMGDVSEDDDSEGDDSEGDDSEDDDSEGDDSERDDSEGDDS